MTVSLFRKGKYMSGFEVKYTHSPSTKDVYKEIRIQSILAKMFCIQYCIVISFICTESIKINDLGLKYI